VKLKRSPNFSIKVTFEFASPIGVYFSEGITSGSVAILKGIAKIKDNCSSKLDSEILKARII
tara:strand:- start:373 stop:558 length:186 start_codon:yes stop_codon:yes gene_type:complete